ncbi:MAG: DUF177 domain-containing protein [Actinomycetota bacterium]|nr:DUF177 domain-containing protein [Actinomycetota bacterium]MDA3013159.1 DUF177 domain-containing protein [Actinomycetota bacterium]
MQTVFKTIELLYAKKPIEVDRIGNLEIKLGNNQISNQSVVKSSIKIIIEDEILKLNLDAKFEIIATCGRCLEEKTINESSYKYFKVNLSSENDYEIILSQENIDILPFLSEIILDKMDENYICQKNCKGLCATCGINLNSNNCNHLEKNLKESPFSSLSKLDL